MKNSVRKGLFHPDDIKTVGLGSISRSPGPRTAPLPPSSASNSPKPSLTPLRSTSGSIPRAPKSAGFQRRHSQSPSLSSGGALGIFGGSLGKAETSKLRQESSEFDKYAEDDNEDYDDVFGKANNSSSEPMQVLQLQTRLSNRSWVRIV